MLAVAGSGERVPISQAGAIGLLRRRFAALVLMVMLLLAAAVVNAPSASANWCGHTDHTHPHNGHIDSYHFHQHWNDGGIHFHTWHNHTHGQVFTEVC